MRTKSSLDIWLSYKAVFALFFMFLSLGFTSCGIGDEDDEDFGIEVGDSAEKPDIIVANDIYAASYFGRDIIFNYDDGVMTGGRIVDEGMFTVTSSGYTYSVSGSDYYKEEFKIKNKNNFGAMTSATVNVTESDQGESYHYSGTMVATYDDDNHIQKLSYEFSDKSDAYGMNYTYSWINGNLIEVKSEYYEIYDGDRYNETERFTYEYGEDTVANNGIYIPGFLPDGEYMLYTGFFGSPTKNIPTMMNGESVKAEVDSQNRITAIYLDGIMQVWFSYDRRNSLPQKPAMSALTSFRHSLMPRHIIKDR